MKRITFISFLLFIFIACNNKDAGNSVQNDDQAAVYLKQGDSIVKITFDTLRKTLIKAISTKGLSGTLMLCNVQAKPITGMYTSEGITVGRVTDKNRNPENTLSAFDQAVWEKYRDQVAKKDSLKSVLISRNNEFHYYKPIFIQPMCLNCHGTPGKEISKELLTVIDSLYPADRAKGYKAGDLRGMWHIVFTKQMAGKD
jgi:hypothetical protein